MSLQGKVVLVTGAGRGLGGAIAQAMAQQGASLVICDIDTEALQATQAAVSALGVPCLALACDVSDSAAVDRMFARAGEQFGTVDVLVNNAARIPSSPSETERRNQHYAYMSTPMPRQALGIVASLSDEDWLKWWGVNMHGVFYCACRLATHASPKVRTHHQHRVRGWLGSVSYTHLTLPTICSV